MCIAQITRLVSTQINAIIGINHCISLATPQIPRVITSRAKEVSMMPVINGGKLNEKLRARATEFAWTPLKIKP